MTTPSFELDQDHLDLRSWVHEFAAEVVRPVAAEWDEREEFPWPVLEEAAKIGLYSLDFFASHSFDPTGLGVPITMEELFWGDAGIGLSIVGSALAAAGLRTNGTDEQVGEWAPQTFGSPGDLKLAAFCSSEPGAGSDVGAMRTRATYDAATDEWVLNGTKTWATNGGLADVHVITAVVDPALRARGQASFVVPPGTRRLSQGEKFAKHGIRASHTAEVVLDRCRVPGRCLLGGQGKARHPARQGPGGWPGGRSAVHGDLRADPARGRRAGDRHRPGGVRGGARLCPDARAVRQADHREPGHRVHARLHGHLDRGVAAAGVAGCVDGASGQAVRPGRGVDVEAVRGGDGREGDRAGNADPRGQRLHPRLPVERMARDAKIYTIFEGTSEIQRLVIARSISGAPIR